jgi:hypothetical protein
VAHRHQACAVGLARLEGCKAAQDDLVLELVERARLKRQPAVRADRRKEIRFGAQCARTPTLLRVLFW